MVRTRTLRFLSLFKSLMVSLLTSTLVFGLYYPSNNNCYSFASLFTCEANPSLIVPDTSECSWDPIKQYCSLRPPPTDFGFTVTVAIITSLISLPIDMSVVVVLMAICARRPVLELIGLDSFTWLGTEPVDLEEYNNAVMPTRFESMGKPQEVTQLFSSVEREEHEITYVLRVIRHYQTVKDDAPNLIVEDLMELFGVTFKDNDLHLSWMKSLRFGDVRSCVGHYLRKSRKDAYNIISNLDRFAPSEVELKESYLVQNFVMEQVALLPKIALDRHFFQYVRDVPRHIHPVIWILGWVYVIGIILFILYYILAWGVTNDGISLNSWGTNFALETLHACFVSSTISLLVMNVFAVEILRPQLIKLYDDTLTIATTIFKHSQGHTVHDGTQLVQLFSPACIASRWVHCENLLIAKVLRSLTDHDLMEMEEVQNRLGVGSISVDRNNTSMKGVDFDGDEDAESEDSDFPFKPNQEKQVVKRRASDLDNLPLVADEEEEVDTEPPAPLAHRNSPNRSPNRSPKRTQPNRMASMTRLASRRHHHFSDFDFGF